MSAVGALSGGPHPEVLRARAYLSRVAEPPAPGLAAFVEAVGAVAVSYTHLTLPTNREV